MDNPKKLAKNPTADLEYFKSWFRVRIDNRILPEENGERDGRGFSPFQEGVGILDWANRPPDGVNPQHACKVREAAAGVIKDYITESLERRDYNATIRSLRMILFGAGMVRGLNDFKLYLQEIVTATVHDLASSTDQKAIEAIPHALTTAHFVQAPLEARVYQDLRSRKELQLYFNQCGDTRWILR